MATFSTNQVRNLYVAKVLGTVSAASAAGTIQVVSDTAKNHLYFKYMSPGGQVRSDLIDIASITYAKATDASSLAHALKRYKVALDSTVNSGAPIAGQDYILRIAFNNYIGLSPENQYFKYGSVHATTGMTAEQFYTTLLDSLTKNFSRETSDLLDFYLVGTVASKAMTTNTGVTVTAKTFGTAGNSIKFAVAAVDAGAAGVTVVTASGVTTITVSLTAAAKTIADLKAAVVANAAANALVTVTGTDATVVAAEAVAVTLTGGATTGIVFEEVEQPWVLGTMPVDFMPFTIQPTTVLSGTEDVIWGVVTAESSINSVKNGKMIADLEYFLMGERGDQYRNAAWPNIVKTSYLVDPTVEYNVFDIHYSYQGSGEGVQKSEKDITIVVPKVGADNSASNVLINTILTAFDSATGRTTTALSVIA